MKKKLTNPSKLSKIRSEVGRKGGSTKGGKKAKASRLNGLLGGRPKNV